MRLSELLQQELRIYKSLPQALALRLPQLNGGGNEQQLFLSRPPCSHLKLTLVTARPRLPHLLGYRQTPVLGPAVAFAKAICLRSSTARSPKAVLTSSPLLQEHSSVSTPGSPGQAMKEKPSRQKQRFSSW